jgi:hypothetical protein
LEYVKILKEYLNIPYFIYHLITEPKKIVIQSNTISKLINYTAFDYM